MRLANCNVATIVGPFKGHVISFGEIYFYDDGNATVYDDFWGNTRYFESHGQTIRYVVTRIVENCKLVW